jgi:hypothetical protein
VLEVTLNLTISPRHFTAEKNKFQRGKSRNSAVTCKQSGSGVTLSGEEEIIGHLYNFHMQLIALAISPIEMMYMVLMTVMRGICLIFRLNRSISVFYGHRDDLL